MSFVRPVATASVFACVASLFFALPSCIYDSPPRPSIDTLADGVLPSATAPIVLRFSEPVVPKTLKVEIAPLVVDEEGNLPDEQTPPSDLNASFTWSYDAGATGGTGTLSDDFRTLTIVPSPSLPIGTSLVLLVEPGISDPEGNTQNTRERIGFGYKFSCDGATSTTVLPASGIYFFVVDVDKPIPVQIQLFADIEVDQVTGKAAVEFVNADRNPDPNRCSPACSTTEACQTLPSPACVVPSSKAGGENEYPDWVVNAGPPTGYEFGGKACAAESNGVVSFATEPTDVVVPVPSVTVQHAVLTASFAVDATGVLRATGSLSAPDVYFGNTSTPTLGPGSGVLRARLIPADEAPEVAKPEL